MSTELVVQRQAMQMLALLMQAAHEKTGLEIGPDQYPIRHGFVPSRDGLNLYWREVDYPEGHIILGKIHKYPHINVLLKGKIAVVNGTDKRILSAPAVVASPIVGTQKVAYVVEDVTWLTIEITETADTEEVERDLTVARYQELGLPGDLPALEGR